MQLPYAIAVLLLRTLMCSKLGPAQTSLLTMSPFGVTEINIWYPDAGFSQWIVNS